MTEGQKLLSGFVPVWGNTEILNGRVKIGDMHRHMGGGRDTTTPRWRSLLALAMQGVDIAAVTNHNQIGYDAVSRARDRIHTVTGKYVEIVGGSEITAMSHVHPGEERHVLVYNAPKFRRLKAFMPLPRLLAEAAEQGADVFLAHPGLGAKKSGGSSMSVTSEEVDDLAIKGLPFGLEVHNGGAAQIDSFTPYVAARRSNPLFSYIEQRLPQSGSNSLAKDLAQIYERVGIGGGDIHGQEKSFVITCVPEGMTVFEAIKRGASVILESKSIPRPHPWDLAVGTVRGKYSAYMMDRRVQHLQARLATT